MRRGRGLLIEAVREQMAARELSRFFDPGVAGRIRGAESEIRAGEGVTRDAAILNVDIRGFTTLAAKMEPADVVAILSAYQDRLVPVIQKHGGTIDKFMGDGIMASFGASAPTDTCAADALRAVDGLIAELDAWPEDDTPAGFDPSKVNMALASGQVVFGAVGSDERLEFTVIGQAVNFSAKLEKFNKELGSRALVTADVLKAAREQGYVPPHEPETLVATISGTDRETQIVRLY